MNKNEQQKKVPLIDDGANGIMVQPIQRATRDRICDIRLSQLWKIFFFLQYEIKFECNRLSREPTFHFMLNLSQSKNDRHKIQFQPKIKKKQQRTYFHPRMITNFNISL